MVYDLKPVNRVTNLVEVLHQGSIGAVSLNCDRSVQLSMSVFALLKPQCGDNPLPGRAVTFSRLVLET